MGADNSHDILFSMKCSTSSPLRSADFSSSHEFWTSEPILLFQLLFFVAFFCGNAAVFSKFPIHVLLVETSNILCAHCCVDVFFCERWVLHLILWLMKSSCVYQTETQVFGSFCRPSLCSAFWVDTSRLLRLFSCFQWVCVVLVSSQPLFILLLFI